MIRKSCAICAFTAALTLTGFMAPALALDEVSFGTNWLAQAEHGGFYQALVDGTYEEYGLKVTIVQGGPRSANRQLMLAGKLDFYMAGNFIQPISSVEQDIPLIEVAAIFQKEPQVLMVHPDAEVETFADIAKLPTIYMSKANFVTSFRWMKSAFPGFSDEQYEPYNFNQAPFIADKHSAQQGYVTSEPYAIEQQGGFKPKLFLLADYGFDTYATMIETTQDFVEANPDIVQRFVDASIIGWYNYLYGDNAAANELIKTGNPEMTDGQIAYSIAAMKEHGIVDSGVAQTHGIGCMTDERVRSFYDKMVEAGVFKAGLDISEMYTTRFVCKDVGKELRNKL